MTTTEAKKLLERHLLQSSISYDRIECKTYPEESILIAYVSPNDLAEATAIGNKMDELLAKQDFNGFVAIRKSTEKRAKKKLGGKLVGGLTDNRVLELQRLLQERSRTTESQPALQYIKDATENIASCAAPRHNLIFGRRGAGKSALLVETMHIVQKKRHLTVWMNAQTFRKLSADEIYQLVVKEILDAFRIYEKEHGPLPKDIARIDALKSELEDKMNRLAEPRFSMATVVPSVHKLVKQVLGYFNQSLYVFLDDFHYLSRDQQPLLLDLLHSSFRDCNAWLKVAAIRNLTRWYVASEQTGLQSGHDVTQVNLDLTLEEPTRAKDFLERVLQSFAEHVGINTLSNVFSAAALNRLILASGAVPRDCLTLSAGAIRYARSRQNAGKVGGEDVNRAAGDAAKNKKAELEEDAASIGGRATVLLDVMRRLRDFCLEDKEYTYFRVDFREKESCQESYALLSSLMDLRLIHLLNSSVSDKSEAGRRYEVYMLDLSEYSGHRLKRQLNVLDFVKGRLVLKKTGSKSKPLIGTNPKSVFDLLRRGPQLSLQSLIPAQTELPDGSQN